VAIFAGLIYAASSANPGYGQWIPLLEEQTSLWLVTGWLLYLGLACVLIGGTLVVHRLRPAFPLGRLLPIVVAIGGFRMIVTGGLMVKAVNDFTVAVTPYFMSEAWDAVDPAYRLGSVSSMLGILVLVAAVVWLVVVAIRAGARRVSAQ